MRLEGSVLWGAGLWAGGVRGMQKWGQCEEQVLGCTGRFEIAEVGRL